MHKGEKELCFELFMELKSMIKNHCGSYKDISGFLPRHLPGELFLGRKILSCEFQSFQTGMCLWSFDKCF
jgi:hypothetical protein